MATKQSPKRMKVGYTIGPVPALTLDGQALPADAVFRSPAGLLAADLAGAYAAGLASRPVQEAISRPVSVKHISRDPDGLIVSVIEERIEPLPKPSPTPRAPVRPTVDVRHRPI